MLPFNTSAFSNLLGASDRAAQRKAVVAPFDEFDAKAEDVMQHIAQFTQRCEETSIIEDFNFIESERSPPSDLDMSDPLDKATWLSDPRRFVHGNILLDSSKADMSKIQAARDTIRSNLKKFSSPPDPVKMPLASKQLVSFQNRQWIYVLLMAVWSANMKTIMLRYQELHDQDGVVLWYCFLQHFAGTTVENLIEAYSQLSETKIQLTLFQDNVLNFTNAIRIPIRRLIKAKEAPSFQHFLTVFHGCMEASNEEFRAFIIALYADYRAGGPTKSLTMLELLDKLDGEYNRINNLGRWVKREDPQVLALTATISTLQSQLSTLKGQYGSLQALVAKTPSPTGPPTPAPTITKLQKPPPRKPTDPEIIEFQGLTWKWCDKCFNGTWNRTHITNEHVAGIGKRNRRRPPPSNETNNNNNNPTPQANIAQVPPPDDASPTVQANVATSSSTLDFL